MRVTPDASGVGIASEAGAGADGTGERGGGIDVGGTGDRDGGASGGRAAAPVAGGSDCVGLDVGGVGAAVHEGVLDAHAARIATPRKRAVDERAAVRSIGNGPSISNASPASPTPVVEESLAPDGDTRGRRRRQPMKRVKFS